MRKSFLFIFLIFLVNSIFSYSSTKTSTDEELQKVFDKNKEIIVVYRNSIKDNIPKKYITAIETIIIIPRFVFLKVKYATIAIPIRTLIMSKFVLPVEVKISGNTNTVSTV